MDILWVAEWRRAVTEVASALVVSPHALTHAMARTKLKNTNAYLRVLLL